MMLIDQIDIFFKRVLNVYKTDGFKGALIRIKDRLRSKVSIFHVFAVEFECSSISDPSTDPSVVREVERDRLFLSNLAFRELTLADIADIEELTDIDPWNIPTSVTLEWLQDGWHCYVAKYQGRIVDTSTAVLGPEFVEPHLRRSLTLADDEVYRMRGFCVPAFRGRGVHPWLSKTIVNHLALTAGIKKHVGWVRIDNKSQMRSLLRTGWTVVGRIGFIEVLGVRFHYIWGRKAFRATRKRFFIQRRERSK